MSGKNFNIGHYMQIVLPNVFIPAMLTSTIEFYHFILLSLTLTLPVGYMVSTKQNLLASLSHTFHLIRIEFVVVMKQFKLNMLRLLSRRFYSDKGSNCCFTDCFKKMMIDTFVLFIVILV